MNLGTQKRTVLLKRQSSVFSLKQLVIHSARDIIVVTKHCRCIFYLYVSSQHVHLQITKICDACKYVRSTFFLQQEVTTYILSFDKSQMATKPLNLSLDSIFCFACHVCPSRRKRGRRKLALLPSPS